MSDASSFLRDTRRRLAEHWLATPGDELPRQVGGDLGRLQRLLMNSAMRFEALEALEDELARSLAQRARDPRDAAAVLAAMLYWRAHRLDAGAIDLARAPAWLVKDLVAWLIAPVPFFTERGESARFAKHLSSVIERIHRVAAAETNGALWTSAALLVASRLDCTPAYANDENLIDLQRHRGALLDWVARKSGAQLDHTFGPRAAGKKMRVGVIARHLRPSAEAFATLPLYEHLKENDVDVVLYVCEPPPANHPLGQYCAGRVSAAKVLPPDLPTRRKVILSDDLDVLFYGTNLSTASHDLVFLAQHRLARVQVTGVANVVTTGLANIDYFLSGTSSDPAADAQAHYTERLFRMEGCAHCFSYGPPAGPSPRTLTRKDLGVGDDQVLFVSGANLYKITPELLDAWRKILDASPKTILLLFPFGPNWYASYPVEAFDRYAKSVLGEERVRVLNPQPPPDRAQLREIFRVADVYLDSFPFAGSTSLIEPLEAELPVVTRGGSTFRAAMGAAMLRELGVDELTAPDAESYVTLATELARDANRRREISRRIRDRMLSRPSRPSFLDSAGYALRIAAAFRAMLAESRA